MFQKARWAISFRKIVILFHCESNLSCLNAKLLWYKNNFFIEPTWFKKEYLVTEWLHHWANLIQNRTFRFVFLSTIHFKMFNWHYFALLTKTSKFKVTLIPLEYLILLQFCIIDLTHVLCQLIEMLKKIKWKFIFLIWITMRKISTKRLLQ